MYQNTQIEFAKCQKKTTQSLVSLEDFSKKKEKDSSQKRKDPFIYKSFKNFQNLLHYTIFTIYKHCKIKLI